MYGRKITFKWVFAAYLALLTALILAAVLHVRSLLQEYEDFQPEAYVRKEADALTAAAASGVLWKHYLRPETNPGRFEKPDLLERYTGYFQGGEFTFAKLPGRFGADELAYGIERDGLLLAEVRLKAAGPPLTRLAIFNYREWAVESVRLLLEEKEYTLSLPLGFTVRVNGIEAQPSDGTAEGEDAVRYSFPGLYLEPDFEIKDGKGRAVSHTVKGTRVLPEIYRYSLTLPPELSVTLNGIPQKGEETGDGLLRYKILELKKPEIKVSDHYGNEISYEGELPVRYVAIAATDRHKVLVDGKPVPEQDQEAKAIPEYDILADYAQGLPQSVLSHIAVLKEDAEIAVQDGDGNLVALEPGKVSYDLTRPAGLEAVPDSVAAEVDVLGAARKWSLFMSRDLSFAELKPLLIKGSYQYKVASKYATGIDITFTSQHILLNPAFTEEKVANFVWITEDCFSVDISFVKHMHLVKTGEQVDDAMNDRFYFVKYDDTDDGVSNPAWKLAGMKEIIDEGKEK